MIKHCKPQGIPTQTFFHAYPLLASCVVGHVYVYEELVSQERQGWIVQKYGVT